MSWHTCFCTRTGKSGPIPTRQHRDRDLDLLQLAKPPACHWRKVPMLFGNGRLARLKVSEVESNEQCRIFWRSLYCRDFMATRPWVYKLDHSECAFANGRVHTIPRTMVVGQCQACQLDLKNCFYFFACSNHLLGANPRRLLHWHSKIYRWAGHRGPLNFFFPESIARGSSGKVTCSRAFSQLTLVNLHLLTNTYHNLHLVAFTWSLTHTSAYICLPTLVSLHVLLCTCELTIVICTCWLARVNLHLWAYAGDVHVLVCTR